LIARPRLPNIDDEPKAAFLNGWWAGNAVGFIVGIGAAVLLLYK
jgi:hypothetical protein